MVTNFGAPHCASATNRITSSLRGPNIPLSTCSQSPSICVLNEPAFYFTYNFFADTRIFCLPLLSPFFFVCLWQASVAFFLKGAKKFFDCSYEYFRS